MAPLLSSTNEKRNTADEMGGGEEILLKKSKVPEWADGIFI